MAFAQCSCGSRCRLTLVSWPRWGVAQVAGPRAGPMHACSSVTLQLVTRGGREDTEDLVSGDCHARERQQRGGPERSWGKASAVKGGPAKR